MSINIDNIKIKSKPDYRRLEKVLKRTGIPDRVPFYEHFSDIQEPIIGSKVKKSDCKDETDYKIKLGITYQSLLGYDYTNVLVPLKFTMPERGSTDTTEGKREYLRSSDCIINSREEFEKYPWPDIDSTSDYSEFEKTSKLLPEGMKIVALSPGGVYEFMEYLMGYENLCINIIEQPELVKDLCEMIGKRIFKHLENYASQKDVIAIAMGDDMGFKTQTLVSPDTFREYIFPWHKKIVDMIHSKGKIAILHSCGQLEKIYEDIISCGWEAKHSWEDTITYVWDFKAKYGNRITPLGGFDVDRLCRSSEAEIRQHTRKLIENTAKGGGWALGTGNSVANYIPKENFLIMLEEAFNYGRY